MKKGIIYWSCVFLILQQAHSQSFEIKSPDERIQLTVSVGEGISWSASLDGKVIIEKAEVGMDFSSGPDFGTNPFRQNPQ